MGWNIRRSALPNDRRYTLPDTMALVRSLVGIEAFDLDAAAEPTSHHAPHWYGPFGTLGEGGCVGLDGLAEPWYGHVFCNPPWSQKHEWVRRAWGQWLLGGVRTITMVLPATVDQAWWHEFVEPHRLAGQPPLVRFLQSRTQYGKPEDPTGATQGTPQFGSCILHWRGGPGR
jgi:hypothetical protein